MLVAASPVPAQDRAPRNSYANPSAVIAAEIALSQDMAARGENVALGAAAAADAVILAPEMVWAGPWLRARAAPGPAMRRQPHAVWSSCDGSLVAARGAWQRGAQGGTFTAIWRREPDGAYKWVLSQSAPAAVPQDPPEMLTAMIADCPERARREGAMPPRRAKPAKAIRFKDLAPLDPAGRKGAAADGSLTWEAAAIAGGGYRLTVKWKKDGAQSVLLSETIPPR